MDFSAPSWLFALLAVPVIALLEFLCARRDTARTAGLVARALWPRVVRRPAPPWRWVRLGLVLFGAAALAVALAGPRFGIVREKVEREGVDVVLALDTSASMATEDVQPNRFFLARAALASLLTRLEGDRFALVACEGDAYPLVPLTLDADAVGLFLETAEPGIVPTPGTSLAAALEKALDLFVDKGRENKTVVLVSDGEDLEEGLDAAIRKAKEAGVTVFTVGVGTERGAPVPEIDRDGNRSGFKKDEAGSVVVSRLHADTLERIARATGGQYVQVSSSDTNLWQIAAAIEGHEKKTLAKEYSYRKKERYQWPLGAAVISFAAALVLPLPLPVRRRAVRAAAAAAAAACVFVAPAQAQAPPAPAEAPPAPNGGGVLDELLLKAPRATAAGRSKYKDGDFPKALGSFEDARSGRPADPRTAFNLADALYKAGKYDEAAALFKALGSDASSPLAAPSRYNLGNALFQKQDYPGAVRAYRDALSLAPEELPTRRNLEMALRALEEQKQQQQKQQQQDKNDDKSKDDKQQQQQQDKNDKQDKKQQQQKQQQQQQQQQTQEQREDQKFRQDTGMPKDQAMAMLDAMQQREKNEQRKQLAAQRAVKRKHKDW